MLPLGIGLVAVPYLLVVGVLWRRRRISDRATTIAATTWAPIFTFAYGVLTGAQPVVLVIATIALLAPGLLMYPSVHRFIEGADH